jgi:hypothetical protein
MRVASPAPVLGYFAEGPGLIGLGPVRLRPASITIRERDELWLTVGIDVRKGCRFVIDGAVHHVLRPITLGALRVFVPDRFRAAGQPKRKDVEPPILIEVIDEDRVAVGVASGVEGCRSRLPERPLFSVARTGVPIRSCDDVSFPVAIEISVVDAFGIELRIESSLDEVGRVARGAAVRRTRAANTSATGDATCRSTARLHVSRAGGRHSGRPLAQLPTTRARTRAARLSSTRRPRLRATRGMLFGRATGSRNGNGAKREQDNQMANGARHGHRRLAEPCAKHKQLAASERKSRGDAKSDAIAFSVILDSAGKFP